MRRRWSDGWSARRPIVGRADGLTLVELMIAMSIIAMVVGTLSTLGSGIQRSYEYTEGHGSATQHARVAIDRINRAVSEATASAQFPGFIVIVAREGIWKFPDTLVVWRPIGAAADPAGLPRFNELVLYCPSQYIPNNLVELTVPSDTRVVPAVTNTTAWAAEIAAIRNNNATQSVTLTTLLRTAAVVDQPPYKWRGALRFEQRLLPSDSEYAEYQAGTRTWTSLSWPQGVCGAKTGMRQAWLRYEIQVVPGAEWSVNDPAGQLALPFFGSAATYYQLKR
jgi:prepilin-type N-terminal cleavage/methylation domain-containing protein